MKPAQPHRVNQVRAGQRARMLERGVALGRNTTSCLKAHAGAMCSTTCPGNALLTTSRVAWLAEMRRHKQTRRWNCDVWVGHEFRCLLISSTAWTFSPWFECRRARCGALRLNIIRGVAVRGSVFQRSTFAIGCSTAPAANFMIAEMRDGN